MKISYMVRYSWNSICNRQDRIFSLLNIFSVAATMLILVALSGMLLAFKDYSESILSKIPLRIDIFKSKDSLIEDLGKREPEIRRMPGVKRPLFTIASSAAAEQLAVKKISADLRTAFARHQCELTDQAAVVKTQDNEWWLEDRGESYFIERQANQLQVYRTFFFKSIPTFISFIDATGKPVSGLQAPNGCTTVPQEPLALRDIAGHKVELFSALQLQERYRQKGVKIKAYFDEIGLIVTFNLLKKLSYLPNNAVADNPGTWQNKKLPERLTIQALDTKQVNNPQTTALPVPLIAVVSSLPRGDYLVAEDFYNILIQWQNPFRYMLHDRDGKPLLVPQPEIIKAYYVLKDNHAEWVDINLQQLQKYEKTTPTRIFFQTWEGAGAFEERLVIVPAPGRRHLPRKVALNLDSIFRQQPQLKDLVPLRWEQEKTVVRNWEAFLPLQRSYQYMQASLYASDRNLVRPLLEQLRTMGLFASSPLERYLKTFESQERFFVGVTLAIFILVLFLSSVVLFSTFYTSILRKQREIGIFKAYGASRSLVLLLFYLQSSIVVCIGSVLGILAGLQSGRMFSEWINSFARLAESKLTFSLPIELILILFGVVFTSCLLAIFIPARLAIAVDPAQVVRN